MIANHEHVGIIPMSGPCELTEASPIISVVVDDAENRFLPGVENIVVIPPEVAVLSD